MKRNARGFTLVEILIVVIILGILAAIVIPQFTNASNDARTSSTQSTLQTLRSQIELFKIQHSDTPPASDTCLWSVLGGRTNTPDTAATNAAGVFGPYVQNPPTNPQNGLSAVGAAASKAVGWVYVYDSTNKTYGISAVDVNGALLTY